MTVCKKTPPHIQTISTYWNFWLDLPIPLKGYVWDAVVQHHYKIHTKKLWPKHGGIRNSVQDISSYGSCQGSFIHLLCLFESLQPSCHVNPHLHSHLSSACGSASNHLGVCCLHFTASLIDLASSVSWGDLHLGWSYLNPSLGSRSQTIQWSPLIIVWIWGD